MSSSEIVNDKNLSFNYPFLVLSDTQNICKTWEKALEDSNFKKEYDDFNDAEKKNINDNIQSRTCQSINNIKQCFTTAGILETCSNIKLEEQSNMTKFIKTINKTLNDKKQVDIKNVDTQIENTTTLIDNLITQYTNRQEMLNMNQGYNNIIDENINHKLKEEIELGDDIEKIDNLKEFTQEDIKDERSNFFWYQSKNNTINKIIRYSLIILIIVIIVYILFLPFGKMYGS